MSQVGHPPQWCPRHELWWSGPYTTCPVCHMVQWYPEPEPEANPQGVREFPVSSQQQCDARPGSLGRPEYNPRDTLRR